MVVLRRGGRDAGPLGLLFPNSRLFLLAKRIQPSSNVFGEAIATLEVIELHVIDRMVDSCHAGGVTHRPLDSIAERDLPAVDAPQPDLMLLNRILPSRGGEGNVGLGRKKDFDLLPDERVERTQHESVVRLREQGKHGFVR